jgi:hypothetical protein
LKRANFTKHWSWGWTNHKLVIVVGFYHLCKGHILDIGVMLVWNGHLFERWWTHALP